MTSDATPSPPRDGSPNPTRGYRFRTILVDASSGQVRTTHDWEDRFPHFKIIPTHDGKFILETYGEIALYSSTFKELQRTRLDSNYPIAYCQVAVAWDGRTFVVASVRKDVMTAELFDADTFKQIASWPSTRVSSSSSVVSSNDTVALAVDDEVSVASVGHPWEEFYASPKPAQLAILSIEYANDSLLVAARANRIVGLNSSGKQLFETEFEPNQDILSIHNSRNGRVFAVKADKSIIAVSWLASLIDPIGGHAPDRVVVYDARDGRPIYQRKMKGDRDHMEGNLALSPDAKLIAVWSGGTEYQSIGVVEVFRLPRVDGVN
jgi:hypothetical protein